MITAEQAQHLATEWVAAWNAHDIERVLQHYTDDFTIETPIAAQVVPESGGRLSGKDAVRAYWRIALERFPDLHFELLDVLSGVGGITIYYLNIARGRKAAELLRLNEDGKVYEAIVHYS